MLGFLEACCFNHCSSFGRLLRTTLAKLSQRRRTYFRILVSCGNVRFRPQAKKPTGCGKSKAQQDSRPVLLKDWEQWKLTVRRPRLLQNLTEFGFNVCRAHAISIEIRYFSPHLSVVIRWIIIRNDDVCALVPAAPQGGDDLPGSMRCYIINCINDDIRSETVGTVLLCVRVFFQTKSWWTGWDGGGAAPRSLNQTLWSGTTPGWWSLWDASPPTHWWPSEYSDYNGRNRDRYGYSLLSSLGADTEIPPRRCACTARGKSTAWWGWRPSAFEQSSSQSNELLHPVVGQWCLPATGIKRFSYELKLQDQLAVTHLTWVTPHLRRILRRQQNLLNLFRLSGSTIDELMSKS